MNKKIVLHPGIYAIEENQALYTRMAARGWILTKRGSLFSYFTREEPQEIYYRMILTKPTSWKEPDVEPSDFKEEGWELVSNSGGAWVYACPQESTARSPLGPTQTLKALKAARNKQLGNILGSLISLLLQPAVGSLLPFANRGDALRWIADAQRFLVQYTAFALLIFGFISYLILQSIYGAIRLTREISKLNQDEEPSIVDEDKGRISVGRMAFVLYFIVFAGLSLVQLTGAKEYEMPAFKEEGYVILEDLGHEKRLAFDPEDPENSERTAEEFGMIREEASLLAQWTDTTEYSDDAFLFQTKATLHPWVDPADFAQFLMNTAVFNQVPEDWNRHRISGVDGAFSGKSGIEYVLVKDRTVLFVRYSGPNSTLSGVEEQKTFLEQVARLAF